MANRRVRALSPQGTRLTDLRILADHTGFQEARYITAAVLAPLISELTTGAITNRATSVVKWNDGAGNEYKATVDSIYKLISDLATAPTGLTDATTYFRIDIGGGGTETKRTLGDLIDYIAEHADIATKINALITIAINGAGMQSIIDARVSTGIAADKESYLQSVVIGGSGYGTLKLERVGKVVTGSFEVGSSETNLASSTTALTGTIKPAVELMFTRPSYASGDENHIILGSDASIQLRIDFTAGNQSGSYPNIPISYCTA